MIFTRSPAAWLSGLGRRSGAQRFSARLPTTGANHPNPAGVVDHFEHERLRLQQVLSTLVRGLAGTGVRCRPDRVNECLGQILLTTNVGLNRMPADRAVADSRGSVGPGQRPYTTANE